MAKAGRRFLLRPYRSQPVLTAAAASTPTFRAASSLTASSTTSAVVTKPTGTQDGDILLVYLYVETTATVTAPAGWTLVTSTATTIGGDTKAYLYWKRASSEGSDWTWSWTGSVTREALCHAVDGCAATGNPWSNYDENQDADADDSVTPGVSVTTAQNDELLCWFGGAKGTGAWTQPTSFNERVDNGGHISSSDLVQASPGSSGSLTGSYAGAGSAGQAILISLKATASTGLLLKLTQHGLYAGGTR